ncbi:MAG: 3-deoxy-manno-octulosonate cytidylyltransferase [Puniceicoccales bacterium]|jgi:3-deoxy-manno-octulosonate cytidylyltransferase (CMP-KDO synthetase)|nr:3-deoxy-manno-octulosonate cytidylyltransferase [Puniceicoccales bacterium]
MKFSLAIPARYASTRLPGKMLADLCGKPVLQHVWEEAADIVGLEEVVVLTEAEIVRQAVESWGGTCWLTANSCVSGTERIGSVIDRFCGDYVFNVQGDEPFLDRKLIGRMIQRARQMEDFDVLTPVFPICEESLLHNPNVVKVVCDHRERALYFSRCPIPYLRDCEKDRWAEQKLHRGHVGIYLYRKDLLKKLPEIPESPLARAESLEQLRFLQAGYIIQTIATSHFSPAIDVPDDLRVAEEFFLKQQKITRGGSDHAS